MTEFVATCYDRKQQGKLANGSPTLAILAKHDERLWSVDRSVCDKLSLSRFKRSTEVLLN